MLGNVNVLVGLLSLVALFYFLFNYKKMNGSSIGFPIYIYFSMFPHKLRVFSIFFADDMILKTILIVDIIMILKKNVVKYNKYEFIILISVLISTIIAFIGSDFFNKSMVSTGVINIIFILIFSFNFRNRVINQEGMHTVFRILINNGIILSVGAIIEKSIFGIERTKLGLGNPNYLGFYLVVAFCLYYFSINSISIKNIWCGIILIVGTLCTGSYSILACFPVFIMLKIVDKILFIRIKKFYSYFIMTGIILTAIMIIWISTSEKILANPIVHILLNEKDNTRLFIWTEAIFDWRNNFITGVGYNCWRSHYGIGYVTHNDFLRILVETGILGISAYLNYYIVLMHKIARSKNQPLYLSLLTTLVIFSSFHNNLNSLLFWIVLSLPLYDNIINN